MSVSEMTLDGLVRALVVAVGGRLLAELCKDKDLCYSIPGPAMKRLVR